MILLNSLLFCMLLFAMGLIVFTFKKIPKVIMGLLMVFCFAMYGLTGNQASLEHYELMQAFQKLGGLDGAISKIEAHLRAHPDDKKGREILRKLYLSKGV